MRVARFWRGLCADAGAIAPRVNCEKADVYSRPLLERYWFWRIAAVWMQWNLHPRE